MIYLNEWLDNQQFNKMVNFKIFLKYCEMESKLLLNNSAYVYTNEEIFKSKYCNTTVRYSIISDCFKFNQNREYGISEDIFWEVLHTEFIKYVNSLKNSDIYLFDPKKYDLKKLGIAKKNSE